MRISNPSRFAGLTPDPHLSSRQGGEANCPCSAGHPCCWDGILCPGPRPGSAADPRPAMAAGEPVERCPELRPPDRPAPRADSRQFGSLLGGAGESHRPAGGGPQRTPQLALHLSGGGRSRHQRLCHNGRLCLHYHRRSGSCRQRRPDCCCIGPRNRSHQRTPRPATASASCRRPLWHTIAGAG